jgi:hypothetical protein
MALTRIRTHRLWKSRFTGQLGASWKQTMEICDCPGLRTNWSKWIMLH